MNPRDNHTLSEALREYGRSATPEELARRGVRQVRCIPTKAVGKLIEHAIWKAISDRVQGLSEPELEELTQDARADLIALLQADEQVETSRNALLETRAELEAELARMKSERDSAQARPSPRTVDPAELERAERELDGRLEALIRDTFHAARASLRSPGVDRARSLARLEQNVVRLCLAAIGEVREQMRTSPAVRASAAQPVERDVEFVGRSIEYIGHDVEIDRLERRVAKLIAALEQSDSALARLTALQSASHGLASQHRTVQGLSKSERNAEMKQRMMTLIFRANVELQQQLSVTQAV